MRSCQASPLFENLVGGSTALQIKRGGGVHTMIGNYICLVKDLAKKELDHGFVLQILSFLQNTFR